jgi:predicted MFS family arabinose efflux permease
VLTAAALVLAGAVWMLAVALFNIGVQLSAPRWVAGRSLAAFQASIAGGIAIGSWGWGHLTDYAGVETALLVSAGLMLLSPLLGSGCGCRRSARATRMPPRCWPIPRCGCR